MSWLLLTALYNSPAAARGYDPDEAGAPQGLGLGLVIGEPTGFTGAWRGGRHTLDAAAAWSLPDDRLHLHGDYLFVVYTAQDPLVPEVAFPLYVGAGGRVRLGWSESGSTLGVRVPLGVSVVPRSLDLPLDAFLELAPVVGLLPETTLDFDAAIGVRVYPFDDKQ